MNVVDKYKSMVTKGRVIVGKIRTLDDTIHCYQIDIAKLAMAACEIKHGGISKGIYTIKNYADDIELPYKTVQNWVSVYRNVVLKLEKEVKTKEEWANAAAANRLLKSQRRNDNKLAEKPSSRFAYKQDVPKGKVREIFKAVEEGKDNFLVSFIASSRSVKTILYKLEQGDLALIRDNDLTSMMETLDEASEIINRYLTKKAKMAKSIKIAKDKGLLENRI